MSFQEIPRSIPDSSAANNQLQSAVNNSYIVHFFRVVEAAKVEFADNYTHEYWLQRASLPVCSLTFIVPSYTFITAMLKIDALKSIQLDNVNDLNTSDQAFQLFCYKKSFSNWKIVMTGTKWELNEVASIILLCQLETLNYVTIELSRNKYNQLCDLGVLEVSDITLIPTGYMGYLVNINIYQENLNPLINVLISVYNDTLPEEGPIHQRHILRSINEVSRGTNASSNASTNNAFKSNNSYVSSHDIGCLEASRSIDISLQLTKAEVGFLIGKNGERINSIRNQTGCKITISPVPIKEAYLLANKKIHQSVKLFGSADKVQNAEKMIHANLAIYRENKSKYL